MSSRVGAVTCRGVSGRIGVIAASCYLEITISGLYEIRPVARKAAKMVVF